MCCRNIRLVGTTLSCEIRYLEAEETFLQSHRIEEFVEIKWKPTQLSITGSSKVAVRQHRSDLRRTEYRAIRKVSKVEQHRSPLCANQYTIHENVSNLTTEIPTLHTPNITAFWQEQQSLLELMAQDRTYKSEYLKLLKKYTTEQNQFRKLFKT